MRVRCVQSFGDPNAKTHFQDDADDISTVSFSPTGRFLATGDCSGRVVLFEHADGSLDGAEALAEDDHMRFRYMTEFQSHEPEFDYLKSMEIAERINQIKWVRNTSSINILSANDKRIKLWKVYEKKVRSICNFNLPGDKASGVRQSTTSEMYAENAEANGRASGLSKESSSSSSTSLRVPAIEGTRNVTASRCRKNFANGHMYHIHSIDLNSDGETFISADDLHINLWNTEVHNECFNMVDVQPENMDELTEVITSALFHPDHCNVLAYSSSKGTIRLADMRDAALCDRHAKIFDASKPQDNPSFFSEIVANITDLKFSGDGRYMMSRDYMTVKLWDLKMESKPVSSFNVQESLSSKLVELYENDCIFDKFECAMSSGGEYIASGSYSNTMRIFGVEDNTDELVEVSFSPHSVKAALATVPKSPRFSSFMRKPAERARKDLDIAQLDWNQKVKHMLWHPQSPLIAVSVSNSLFMMSCKG